MAAVRAALLDITRPPVLGGARRSPVKVAVMDAVGELCLLGAHPRAAGEALRDRTSGHRHVSLASGVRMPMEG
jgi:hypothetical protein